MKKILICVFLGLSLSCGVCLSETTLLNYEEAKKELKKWAEVILSEGGEESLEKYVKFDTKTMEYLNPEDARYENLQNHETGKYVISNKYTKKYTFAITGKDIWDNGETKVFYIGMMKLGFNEEQEWDLQCFDGEHLFGMWKVNPPLIENPDVYYIIWEDATKCPLKILAYRIYIDKYDTVNVDLIVQNNAKKLIVGFGGYLKMYDKMGHPVTWGGSDNVFGFMSQEKNIHADSKPYKVGEWILRLYEKTRRINPGINEIKFEDGSFWKLKNK